MSPEDIEAILDLEPEELALQIIRDINGADFRFVRTNNFSFDTFFAGPTIHVPKQTRADRQTIQELEMAYR